MFSSAALDASLQTLQDHHLTYTIDSRSVLFKCENTNSSDIILVFNDGFVVVDVQSLRFGLPFPNEWQLELDPPIFRCKGKDNINIRFEGCPNYMVLAKFVMDVLTCMKRVSTKHPFQAFKNFDFATMFDLLQTSASKTVLDNARGYLADRFTCKTTDIALTCASAFDSKDTISIFRDGTFLVHLNVTGVETEVKSVPTTWVVFEEDNVHRIVLLCKENQAHLKLFGNDRFKIYTKLQFVIDVILFVKLGWYGVHGIIRLCVFMLMKIQCFVCCSTGDDSGKLHQ